MVRLGKAPAGDQRVGALGQRLADEELGLPHLVAAEREPGQVVSLDQEPPAELARELRQLLQRRLAGEQAEPRGGRAMSTSSTDRKNVSNLIALENL